MSSKFKDWMSTQPIDFIREIYPDLKIPEKFKQETRSITLKELIELDNKFINNPEGDINGSNRTARD